MTRLFYMTGTGNSFKIAKDIGDRLGEYELISIPRLLNTDNEILIEGDIIGFIIPVYFGRPPVFFQEFIKKAVFRQAAYSFVILNGGGLFGSSMRITEKLLKKRGLAIDAGFIIEMPGTHPYISRIHRTPVRLQLKKAAEQIQTASDSIKKRTRNRPVSRPGILSGIYCLFAFDIPYDLSKRYSMDEHFWINDGCRNCGLCIEICPAGNIYQSKWKPKWRHNCMNCLACYHLCPFKGIELLHDWKMIDMIPYDLLTFRYRNPDLTEEELFNALRK